MTKVPPKIQPPPPRPRRPRADDPRKAPGALGAPDPESLEVDPLTMGERLELEQELAEDLRERRSDPLPAEDEARRREERRDDEEAFARKERKDERTVQRKDSGAQGGDQRKHKTQEELRAEANLRRSGGLSDGFEGTALGPQGTVRPGAEGSDPKTRLEKGPQLSPLAPPPPPPDLRLGGGGFGAAMKFLNDAREPGTYFRQAGEGDAGSGQAGSEEESELLAAVEEARALLGGLRGIDQIGPGRDHEDQPVVLILTGKGFCESSMRAIPEQVHRFRTLVGLPYELLPLRRI